MTSCWYDDRENLRQLAQYILEQKDDLDIVYFLEKPWKYGGEWIEYQKTLETFCHDANVRFYKTKKGWYDIVTRNTMEEHP